MMSNADHKFWVANICTGGYRKRCLRQIAVGWNDGFLSGMPPYKDPGKPAWMAWQMLCEGEIGSDAAPTPTGPVLGCVFQFFFR